MGRAWFRVQKTLPFAALAILFAVSGLGSDAWAQCNGTSEEDPAPAGFTCPPGVPLAQGSFHATPLMDGNSGLHYPSFGVTFNIETVSLYGQYGNNEQTSDPEAQAHYIEGLTRANMVHPLLLNGSRDDQNGSIVALIIGFSNCAIEICGGQYDAFHLPLQPCSSDCNNPMRNPNSGYEPWNTAPEDPVNVPQKSLLWQIYSPDNGGPLVGPRVYVFSGAKGKQVLAKWDPSPSNPDRCMPNAECNYNRVAGLLSTNGFSEQQVQVIFVYAADNYPQCDLSGVHCNDPLHQTPDAYLAERHMGNIVRYLKSGLNGTSRYPHLQQVFIISRNYGGYAKNPPAGGTDGCLNPEPFAYEEGFSVQRLTVAQIKQAANPPKPSNDQYSGLVDYSHAPWFDWGPYLWASADTPRNDGLVWCNAQGFSPCNSDRDFRLGDPLNGLYGDLTHPAHTGQTRAATKILDFLLNSPFTQAWIQTGR